MAKDPSPIGGEGRKPRTVLLRVRLFIRFVFSAFRVFSSVVWFVCVYASRFPEYISRIGISFGDFLVLFFNFIGLF